MELIIVTGLSGAGRRAILSSLEDMGCVALDNVPASLLEPLLDLEAKLHPERARLAVGMDSRHEEFATEFGPFLERLASRNFPVEVIFAEASDEVLVRRYSETRRPHNLAPDGDLRQAIARERRLLAPVRERATLILDTSRLTLSQLKLRLAEALPGIRVPGVTLRLLSFGFKHGLPPDADMVLDARFLPNPHYVPELRPLSGKDGEVQDFLLAQPNFVSFLERTEDWIRWSWPLIQDEARAYHTIAVGCTGGQHRSVAVVELLASRLGSLIPRIATSHRELPG
ncbi:MAG: RNase adapter RapZ [Acidobacteria bacterium]|nr:RNase adapter RapZ [Acidobacteriota bacterium]